MAAGFFALALALGMTSRILTGATSSTSTVSGTSPTDFTSSVSYGDSSSYYSYNSFHPDYLDCNISYASLDIGDGNCDASLNVARCGWDGGDCCVCTCNSTAYYGCSFTGDDCKDPSSPLDMGYIGCYNISFQAPRGSRCLEDEVEWVVESTASASALADETLCSGGYFEVEWRGYIDVIKTIYIVNGTRLHITGVSDAVADGGGALQIFFVYNGSLYLNDMIITNSASSEGGAIILDAGSELFTDNVEFSTNIAQNLGGAVYVSYSKVELVSSRFDGNSAPNGGAMFVYNSFVFGSGNNIFIGNNVSENGGAIYITETSYVGWNMQRELIATSVDFTPSYYSDSYDDFYSWSSDFLYYSSYYSWTVIEDSGQTFFLSNSAGGSGGAMHVDDGSELYWSGSTTLQLNKATYGGALYLNAEATVRGEGETTIASNYAIFDGGGIGATGEGGYLSVNGLTIFTNNTCGGNGGAIDLSNIYFAVDGNLTFSHNSAESFGGALYASQREDGFRLTGVTFLSNNAEAGGAVFFSAVGTYALSYSTYDDYYGSSFYANTFDGCQFDGNSASSTGGAIHSAAGIDYLLNTTFVKNSADIGGGMRVSGTVYLLNSSFQDNKSGEGGGPAISNGGIISKMVGLFYSGNGYHCSPDAFMDSNETTVDDHRYEVICDGCGIECYGCVIEDDDSVPYCSELFGHTDSQGGIATLETLILDPGYWRATNTSRNILQCFNEKACRGGVTGNPQYCLTGFEGPYCDVCSHGYVRTLSGSCGKCLSETSSGPAVFSSFAGIAGLLLLLLGYYMIRIEESRANRQPIYRFKKVLAIQSFKIIIVSWQIVTQFSAVANVVYPRLYQEFLDVVALVNFDFRWILSAGCLDVEFYFGLIAATTGPLAVMVLMGLTYTIAMRRNYGSEVGQRIVQRKHANAAILIAFLVYSSASSFIFSTFACDSLDDGNMYLRADYRIDCESPKHIAFQIYAGFMIAVYPLGIPVLFAILLFRNREVLENGALRTHNRELVHQSTSSLWKPYKPSAFYFEVVECARRLMLAGIVVFIYPDTAAQVAVTLAMAFIFALASEHLNPYESKMDGWVARIGHFMVVLTMFVALLTKMDVSDEGTQSRRMFAGILVSTHVAMILTGVAEAVLLIYSVQQTDSPLPRERSFPELPVDNVSSTHGEHFDNGMDNEDFQGKLEHE